jgi:hypothetical protein
LSDIKHKSIYKDDTGELFLEQTDFGLVIHMYSYKWSKETYNHYIEVWVDLIEQLQDKGYTEVFAAIKDLKLLRFASMFGFEITDKTIEDNNNETRVLMKCSFKNL